MINTIVKVNEYLSKKVSLYSHIMMNVFHDQGTEEIICRQDPSSANEVRYMNGKRNGVINFSYYTKSTDQQKANNMLNDIIAALDIQQITEISEGLFVRIEAVSNPVFVLKRETGEYIFTSSFTLEYISQ